MNKTEVSKLSDSQRRDHSNRKRKLLKSPLTVLLGILLGIGSLAAYAVDGDPPGLLELDGDTADSNAVNVLPDDWDSLYTLDPNFGGQPVAFTGILADPAPVSIYWKGGSKDVLDIPNWWFKDGSVPDKDDITNAYAAGYLVQEDVCLDGAGDPVLCSDASAIPGPIHMEDDLIVYFGLDRYDNSGDAFAGFWFLQDKVTMANNQFDGEHVPRSGDGPGDLLALVEYPQGANAHPTIKVYEWDPMDWDGDGNLDEDGHSLGPLDLIITVGDAECDGLGNKLACAITNIVPVGPPLWDYTPKGGMEDDPFPEETFYEGGLNVTQLLSGENICISTFLAETRSSRSETAQLKDLVLGNFDLCSSTIRTEIHTNAHEDITFTSVKAGTTIHDFAEVKVKGPGLTLDPTGTVNFYLYENGTCEGTPIDSDLDVPLSGGTPDDATATAETKDFNLAAAKTYSFHADYVSDNPDFPSSELQECEVVTIDKYESKISTQIHEAGGHSPDIQNTTVYVGLTIHDHAYVEEKTGGFPGAPTPTGDVMFMLFSTLDCSGDSVDSSASLSGGEAVTGDVIPMGDTFLSFKASYAGDANYTAATDDVCEPLTIIKYDSALRTEIHKGSDHSTDVQGMSVDIGDSYHDHAYWSETTAAANAPVPTGDVTFEVYANTACSGAPLASFGGIDWPQSGGLDGSLEAVTQMFTPPAGELGIKASWQEDDNYHGSEAACESLTVDKLDPTVVTKVVVRDLAFVSGAGAPPTGTVTFKTYLNDSCSGDPASTSAPIALSGGEADQPLALEQLLETNPDVVSYIADYSGDDNYNPKVHNCEVVQFSVLP